MAQARRDKMNKKKSDILFTLITGASAGIGKALAEECAKKNRNLILISLPGENLEKLSESLRDKYKIHVKFFEIDLTQDDAPHRVYRWTLGQGLSVNRLINNAGMGYRGSFEEYSPQFFDVMMRLNMISVVTLTRLFLPELKKHEFAEILNLGSMAAFLPIPYKAVYAATKAFIYSFSIALREELRGTGVNVFILCPGSVPTNNEVKNRIETDGWLSKISLLPPQKVAQIALSKMEDRVLVIVPGLVNRIYMLLGKLVPKSTRPRMMARVFRKNHSLLPKKQAVAL
jgi:short-subunit dehydrogenase